MSKPDAELTLSTPVNKADMEAYADVVYVDLADSNFNGIAAHNNDQGVHGVEEKFNSISQDLLDLEATLDKKQDLSGFGSGEKANVAGDIFTGTVEISNSKPNIQLNSVSATKKAVSGTTSGFKRWELILGDDTAETGSNNGSLLKVDRYNDAGNRLGTSLAIDRTTGTMYVNALSVEDGDYYEVAPLDIHWSNAEPVAPPAGQIWMLKETLAPGAPADRTLLLTTASSVTTNVAFNKIIINFPEDIYASRFESVNGKYFYTAFSDTKDYFRYNGVTYTVTPPTTDRPFFTNKELANTWLFEDNGYMWFIYTTTAHNMVVYKINLTTMNIQSSHVIVGGEFDQPAYGKRRHINLPNGKIGLMILHRPIPPTPPVVWGGNSGTIYDVSRFDIDPDTMAVSRKYATSGWGMNYTVMVTGTGGWAHKHSGYQMVWSKGFFENIPTPYDTFGEGQTFVSYISHVPFQNNGDITASLFRVIHGNDGMRIDGLGSSNVTWPNFTDSLKYQLFLPPTEKRRSWWVFRGEGSNDIFAYKSPHTHLLYQLNNTEGDSERWNVRDGWLETTGDRWIYNDDMVIMCSDRVNSYPSFNLFISTEDGLTYNNWMGDVQYWPVHSDVARVMEVDGLTYISMMGNGGSTIYQTEWKTFKNFSSAWEHNGGLVPSGTAFAPLWPTVLAREPSRVTDSMITPGLYVDKNGEAFTASLSSSGQQGMAYVLYTATERGPVSKTYPYVTPVPPEQAYASYAGGFSHLTPAGKHIQVMFTSYYNNIAQWTEPTGTYSYYNARAGWIGKMTDESRRYYPLLMPVRYRQQSGVGTPFDSTILINFEFHIHNDNGIAKYDLKLITGMNSRDMVAVPQYGPGGTTYCFDLKPRLRFKYYDENWELLKTAELLGPNSDNVTVQCWGTPNYTKSGTMPDWPIGTKWVRLEASKPSGTQWGSYPVDHWVAINRLSDPGFGNQNNNGVLYIPTPYGVV